MLLPPGFFSHELTSHNSREGMFGFRNPFVLNYIVLTSGTFLNS